MQIVIELIRKIVVFVLLMEVVLQLQSGRQYESYIRMLIGIMVVYLLVRGVYGIWYSLEDSVLAPLEEFQWKDDWFYVWQQEAQRITEDAEKNMQTELDEIGHIKTEVQIEAIRIRDIRIEDVRIEP